MEIKCKVDFGGIEEALGQLGPKLARKTLRKAVSKVGTYWVNEMKQRVPVDTGDLRESIGKRVSTQADAEKGSATVSVGPMFNSALKAVGASSAKPGVYGMFVELGTKRSRPQPFMRPVFDASAEKVVQILADTLREDLESIAKSRS